MIGEAPPDLRPHQRLYREIDVGHGVARPHDLGGGCLVTHRQRAAERGADLRTAGGSQLAGGALELLQDRCVDGPLLFRQ
jgi:hypothetical protein